MTPNYIVRSGGGYVANPDSLEMVGGPRAKADAFRFHDLASVLVVAAKMLDQGLGAELILVDY